MSDLLRLQFTLFALVALGCFVRKKDMVGKEGQKNITDLVINVVLPCNIFNSFMQEIDSSALFECILVLLISAGIQLFSFFYGKFAYRKMDGDRKKNLTYGIMISNAGFLGNPVAEGIYGPIGLMLASIYLIPVRLMMWSEGLSLFAGPKNVRETVKKVATHPCVVACFVGITVMLVRIFTGITILPDFLLSLIATVGRCNTALSMMVVGMIVAQVKPADFFDPIVFRFSFERLILIPAVTALCLLPFLMTGHISKLVFGVSVVLAAMPAATTTSMLAAKYDCAPAFSAKMVVVSTVLSIPTIFIWGLLLAL